MAASLKVALVGPLESGKTRFANALADQIRRQSEYDPTVGVRILEFDKHIRAVNKDDQSQFADVAVRISCWDLSGDQLYESGWSAVTKDLNGIVIVFDPRQRARSAEVEIWYEWFRKRANLDPRQVLCVANLGDGADAAPIVKLPKSMAKAKVKVVRVMPGTDAGMAVLHDAFAQWLGERVYGFHPDAKF